MYIDQNILGCNKLRDFSTKFHTTADTHGQPENRHSEISLSRARTFSWPRQRSILAISERSVYCRGCCAPVAKQQKKESPIESTRTKKKRKFSRRRRKKGVEEEKCHLPQQRQRTLSIRLEILATRTLTFTRARARADTRVKVVNAQRERDTAAARPGTFFYGVWVAAVIERESRGIFQVRLGDLPARVTHSHSKR